MKALGLVVLEIFLCFFPIVSLWELMTPGAGPILTKYESSGPCGFGEEIFLCFSHCKSMGANDPRDGAIFDPRGMIGRIYIEDHYTLLHTKYESSWPCGFREDFFIFSS